ncbi:MAG: haloacid dehalogenase type II [Sneathiellales bacterium]|nr:haloacid dehalogenase type II [Sneathiellales bacterium]
MTEFSEIKACVFDAYGTLFDVNAAARHKQDALGEKWEMVSEIWRTKQLQYTWLRSLQDNYVEFWQVTEQALEFALQTAEISDNQLKKELMELYLQLDAYPEVAEVLKSLKAAGIKTAILSNGSPAMLQSAVENAGIAESLDAVLSVDDLGVYKPHPSVYQLAVDKLDVAARHVSFQSSNGWDAYSARDFGFNVLWCNRFGQAPENIPSTPDQQITDLKQMLPILGL